MCTINANNKIHVREGQKPVRGKEKQNQAVWKFGVGKCLETGRLPWTKPRRAVEPVWLTFWLRHRPGAHRFCGEAALLRT